MKTVLAIIIFYGVYCALLYFAQRGMIFPRYLIGAPLSESTIPKEIESWWLDSDSGRVEAWYLKPATADAKHPVVIFAHGNAELIDYWPPFFQPLRDMGVAVLLVEYPGYGRSKGSPGQEQIGEVFSLAYDRLIKQTSVDTERIVFWGRSVGGGAVCELARRRKPAAMILMSAFTAVRPFARRYLVPAFLIKDPFDNLAVVAAYSGPVLIVHGRRDDIIPVTHARQLAQAASNGRLIEYDCGHNDCPPDGLVFWDEIKRFLISARIIDLY